jgi:hypothetical protein
VEAAVTLGTGALVRIEHHQAVSPRVSTPAIRPCTSVIGGFDVAGRGQQAHIHGRSITEPTCLKDAAATEE